MKKIIYVLILLSGFAKAQVSQYQKEELVSVAGIIPAQMGTFFIKTKDNSFLMFKEIYQDPSKKNYLLSVITKYRPQVNDTTIVINNNANLTIFSYTKINSTGFTHLNIDNTFIHQ